MRRPYLDNIRSLTVLLVVVYHVFYMFNGVATAGVIGPFREAQAQDAVQYVLFPWFMVLLFIVSGMCAKYYLEAHTARDFARTRTVKLLVPSTLGLFVFQWIQGYCNMRISGAFDQMKGVPGVALYLIMAVSGIGVLWYIQLLWVFSMLLLLVRAIERGKLLSLCGRFNAEGAGKTALAFLLLCVLGVVEWLCTQVLNTPVIVVYRCGLYGFAFFVGYYLFSHEQVTDFLARFWYVFAVAAVALCVAYTVRYFGENYAIEPVVNSPLAVAFLWTACLAILGGMKRCANKTGAVWQFLGKKSWGLYVFHYLPLSLVALLLTEHTALPPVCIYLVTGAAALVGALILNEIISRIPFVRWCVLGIRGKRRGR